MQHQKNLLIGPDKTGKRLFCVGGLLVEEAKFPKLSSNISHITCPNFFLRLGNVNAHTHLYSGLVPLMPPLKEKTKSFLDILKTVWWRLDRALDAQILRASARYYIAQALLSGTTTLIDHHESPNLIEGSLSVLGEAFQEVGARGVLTYGATERNYGISEANRGLIESARFIKEDLRGNTHATLRGMIGLHAPFTASDSTIKKAVLTARKLQASLHLHVAESHEDNQKALQLGYRSVFERLQKLGAIRHNNLFAHGVHLTEKQVNAASEAGIWFAHNPRSNDGNQVGFAKTLIGSKKVVLGTDGYPANMYEEISIAEHLFRANKQSIHLAVERAKQSRRFLGSLFNESFLELAPNNRADIVIVDKNDVVKHVIVEGKLVVENGKLVSVDMKEIQKEAEFAALKLGEKMRRISS